MYLSTLQVELDQNATGLPQVAGAGRPAATSDGMLGRGQNQVETPVEFQVIAQTPPPTLFRPLPYAVLRVSPTPQPMLLFVRA